MIPKSVLLTQLKAQISAEELAALRAHTEAFPIREYNRATLLRMMDEEVPEDTAINESFAHGLTHTLRAYLTRYMPDKPDAHKWIIISCAYLALVVEEPMHPQQIVKWEERDGNYYCPAKELSADSVCRYCVCKNR